MGLHYNYTRQLPSNSISQRATVLRSSPSSKLTALESHMLLACKSDTYNKSNFANMYDSVVYLNCNGAALCMLPWLNIEPVFCRVHKSNILLFLLTFILVFLAMVIHIHSFEFSRFLYHILLILFILKSHVHTQHGTPLLFLFRLPNSCMLYGVEVGATCDFMGICVLKHAIPSHPPQCLTTTEEFSQ